MKKIFLLVILILGVQTISAEEKTATFAGGCFWCTQAAFDEQPGVLNTVVGYTGGDQPDPNYVRVCTGKTGYAESINIKFDPEKVTYQQLLKLFFEHVDPFDAGGQFYDRGTEYRLAIFYHDDQQKLVAETYKKDLEAKFKKPVYVSIEPVKKFYEAEEYHQKYYQKNPIHYNMYKDASGREEKLEKIWDKDNK